MEFRLEWNLVYQKVGSLTRGAGGAAPLSESP